MLLDDPGGTVKREFDGLYFDFPHYNRCGFGEPHASMRRGPHKLLDFFISNRSLLFDLSADIGEATDLSAQLESKTLQFRDELMSQRCRAPQRKSHVASVARWHGYKQRLGPLRSPFSSQQHQQQQQLAWVGDRYRGFD